MQVLCSNCSQEVSRGSLGRCPGCGGILQPHYSDTTLLKLKKIEPGPGIDRYRPVLPVSSAIPFLGEGDTPLIRSRRLGPSLGLENLYFKNEGRNPSGSFKDRPGALAVALAREAGAKGVLTASSGNAATAISAYAAAAGLKCLILLEPGNPPAKLRQALATGAQVVPVKGIFAHGPEELQRFLGIVAARLNYYLGFIWAPVNPYILEGIKSMSYEIVARLPGPPDVVVCPVGGGDMFTAQWRGYLEMKGARMIKQLPRMVAVQSINAPPLLKAFQSGADRVSPLPSANSKISGINVPFTGDHALAAVRNSGGLAIGVKDEKVFDTQRQIGAEEGIWTEPAGAAPVAAIWELLSTGMIRKDERIVCILSGAGFKDSNLAEAEALEISQRKPIEFDVEAKGMEDFFKQMEK
jgi:threonine synthase